MQKEDGWLSLATMVQTEGQWRKKEIVGKRTENEVHMDRKMHMDKL